MAHRLANLGWVDLDLGSSPCWWAAPVATYCPRRMMEHPKSKSTEPSAPGDWPPCKYILTPTELYVRIFFQNTITRMPHPYTSKCINDWNQTTYELETDLIYSLSVCDFSPYEFTIINLKFINFSDLQQDLLAKSFCGDMQVLLC